MIRSLITGEYTALSIRNDVRMTELNHEYVVKTFQLSCCSCGLPQTDSYCKWFSTTNTYFVPHYNIVTICICGSISIGKIMMLTCAEQSAFGTIERVISKVE